ncbi:class I SAM-dependent methyltransferase [Candidatus Parcubacteria bacterium]|nr:class I SAM-dependent methyltransferase [Candidatus Parcubacteria bacterium]
MFSDPQKNIDQFGLLPNQNVADLGAGSGFYTLAAAKALSGTGHVYALDVQKDLLVRLKNAATHDKIFNIEIIWGDVEKLGGTHLRENSVDAVISANILFQMRDKKTFISEIARIIKPKGRVLTVDWTDSFGGLGPHPDAVIKAAEARQMFESGGFKFEKEIAAGQHHWGMILKKT